MRKKKYAQVWWWVVCVAMIWAMGLPTDAVAQVKKKKKAATPAAADAAKKPDAKSGGVQPYGKVITKDAVSDKGLFAVHKVEDKYFFELPDTLLGREILLVSRISGTVKNLNFGGAGMKSRPQQVVRWERKDNSLLLRSVSYTSVADAEKPIYQSVKNNNFEPIIMVFPLKAFGKDSATYVIEVNELFTTDVEMIGALTDDQRKDFSIRSLDSKRSLVMWMNAFPQNVEVRHILTYNGNKLPANQLTNTLSLEMNQSFLLLPKVPMMPRIEDARVGFFSVTQTDYGLDEHKATNRNYITRWRLEPKDPEAFRRGELVEPVKQIVYYIDPATPSEWVPYLIQGVNDWQAAFEAAGFKNAIVGKEAPKNDPEWHPEDSRYSVIRYITTDIQNAQGPHVHDPRSGEILESDILWYHNVMNLLRNWFFVQTAAINPAAQRTRFDDALMGQLIRFVAAHEVGHTLGLPHNMGASFAYPVDSLRSKTFTAKMGTAPSIMDYARFNYVAQPEDKGVSLMPNVGIYDKYAIRWGYRPILEAKTPADEQAVLHQWVMEHANDPIYWFGQQTANAIDPRAQTEDLGNDAMKASDYGIRNLKRIVPNLIKWTGEKGEDYAELTELYEQVVGQYSRYMGHVKSNIGGVYVTPKTADQSGEVYAFVPEATQRRAMQFLHKELFETPNWLMERSILERIDPTTNLNRIATVQKRTLHALLDPSRMARLLEFEAAAPAAAYTCEEMLDELRNGIFGELRTGAKLDMHRRSLQRMYVERLAVLMQDDKMDVAPSPIAFFFGSTPVDVSTSDITALVRADLRKIEQLIATAKTTDSISRYHLDDLKARIARIFEDED